MNAYKSFNELTQEASTNGSITFIWCGDEYKIKTSSEESFYIIHGDNSRFKGYVATVDHWSDDEMTVFALLFSSLVQSTIRIEDVFKPLNQ